MGGGTGMGFVSDVMSDIRRCFGVPFEAPKGDDAEKFIIHCDNGRINLIGRCKKQNSYTNNRGLVVKYLRGMPGIDNGRIVKYIERSGSGAYGEFVNKGTKNEYRSLVWAEFNPLLEEVML
jgi:hypothetical protein